MMGPPVRTVERLQKITTRVLSFDKDTTHLLLDERLRRYFFPQHTRLEPHPKLHSAVTSSADCVAQRKFDDKIRTLVASRLLHSI
jgi:hypothetical protein